MLRLVDRNHAPAIPKSYAFQGGLTVPWESGKQTFSEFVQKVHDVAQANGKLMPTVEQIEDQICQRLPRGWCTSLSRFDRPPSSINVAKRERKPCKTCGRRK